MVWVCMFLLAYGVILWMLIEEHNRLMVKVKMLQKKLKESHTEHDEWIDDIYERYEEMHTRVEKDYYNHMNDMNGVTRRFMDICKRLEKLEARESNNSFNDQESKGENK